MHPVLLVEAIVRGEGLLRAAKEVIRIGTNPQSIEVLFSQIEVGEIKRMVLPASDRTTRADCKLPSSETISWLAPRSGGRFPSFASVNPDLGEREASELERGVRGLGLRGLRLSPPNAVSMLLAFSYAAGCELTKYNLALEKWAAELPELAFILAHLEWPWVWEVATLDVKYPNAHLDLSNIYTGALNKHLKYLLIETVPCRVVERLLAGRIPFGPNYPAHRAEQDGQGRQGAPPDPEVGRAILFANAAALLRISRCLHLNLMGRVTP
ncbi:MAG: hypothetical protein DRJ56_02465 [Thermoprotei archaeon]|nr:MAG: hypothetical protein DRJ56_02465 [Thermoprotei archaeon]